MGRSYLILTRGCYKWLAVANGAATHSALDLIRNRNRANILVQRTSPAHFFVKCRGASNITLAIEVHI